ncbi:MAG TPA: ABC transporter permease [Vicinamibacterales bacterium]|jgi:predicted permease|nr:ABC transporter permease [Vicinamibacterales bacterium]
MDTLRQDIRFGWRLLRRTPGFTISAVLALALGVGTTTAIFSVLDHVVLRPLPYPDPDRLAMVWEANDGKGLPHERISPVNFVDYRGLSQVFEDAAAWWYPQLTLTETGHDPLRVSAIETTPNFFSVLGVQPIIGAGFPQGPAFARDGIAVISHRLWRERFGSDPSIVGKTVALNGPLFTITGIMPQGFQYPNDTDVWHRITWDVAQHSRGAHFMESIFRLKPGVTVEAANNELRALTRRLGQEYPSTNGDYTARAVPLATEIVGFFRPALLALFAAAAFLLVITCTNVASLLLARATVREREVAVRAAIGANKGRLIRQFLTESVLLAMMGTALGVVVAVGSVRALVAATPVELPRLAGIGLDPRMLLFAIALALLTAIAFGVIPAMLMARGDMQRPLKESGRGGDGGGARQRARSTLVVAEISLAVMLLVGAALLARSFQRLVQQDPGFKATRAVTAKVELPYSYADFSKIADFYDRLLTSVRAQPGVSIAGASNFLPLEAAWRGPFFVQGRPRPRSGDEPQAQHQTVDDDYFRALGVPLVKGRFFDATDSAAAPGVIIVNDALARRQWPNEDPIGQAVVSPIQVIGPMGRSLMKQPLFQVVGVVASVKNSTLVREAEPAIYFTFRQFPFRGLNIVVQGQGDAAALLGALRTSVRRIDPNLPLASARTVDRIIGEATDRPRALMLLMGIFAALALVLSALGIYSVMSYSVNQRRQELSVRMALGAQANDVLWLVVRQGLRLALMGGAVGTVIALVAGRFMSSLLYGVSSVDAAAFIVAIALALVTALAACLLPARRAAALDPLAGLRAD